MAGIQISGIGIEYELLGPKNAPAIVLTPGGRFAKDSPGLPELAQALAAGGRRVLLWDRPNCGASDISFEGESESALQARTLIELIRTLELGPTAVAAGSGGSRVSLIAAARDPEAVSHLIVWWISGGALSLISLAAYYCVGSAIAASRGGMAARGGFAGMGRANPAQSQEPRHPPRAGSGTFHRNHGTLGAGVYALQDIARARHVAGKLRASAHAGTDIPQRQKRSQSHAPNERVGTRAHPAFGAERAALAG